MASTSHIVDKELWNIIWRLKIPNRIRNILWKVGSYALPVGGYY